MEASLTRQEEKEVATNQEILKEQVRDLYFIRRRNASYVAESLGIKLKDVFLIVDEIIKEVSISLSSDLKKKLVADIYLTNNEIINKAWEIFECSDRPIDKNSSLKIIGETQRQQIEMLTKLGVLDNVSNDGENTIKKLIDLQYEKYEKAIGEREKLKAELKKAQTSPVIIDVEVETHDYKS